METQKITSAGFFRSLTVIHAAMIVAPVILTVVMIYLSGRAAGGAAGANSIMSLLTGVSVVGLSAIAMSFVLFNALVAKAVEKPTLSEKLRGYQSASMVRFALPVSYTHLTLPTSDLV